jgi:hypothetical protein
MPTSCKRGTGPTKTTEHRLKVEYTSYVLPPRLSRGANVGVFAQKCLVAIAELYGELHSLPGTLLPWTPTYWTHATATSCSRESGLYIPSFSCEFCSSPVNHVPTLNSSNWPQTGDPAVVFHPSGTHFPRLGIQLPGSGANMPPSRNCKPLQSAGNISSASGHV